VKEMKKILVLLCTVTLIFGVVGTASAFLFDFESLQIGDGDAAIETYMEDIYGSDITVTGAIVATGGQFGTEKYLTFADFNADGFSVTFEVIPIASVQFDWGVDYHNLRLDADGDRVFEQRWGHLVSGQTLLAFNPDEVSTLDFYGERNNSGMFMIDNLGSSPTPEPGTLFLLGSGLLGFARVGRKHLLKQAT